MSNRPETRDGSLWADADADAALRRFRALADVVDDGIIHLDASGQFVSVDETFVATTGFEREELLGEHVSTVLADGDGERLERLTADVGAAAVEGADVDGPSVDGGGDDGPDHDGFDVDESDVDESDVDGATGDAPASLDVTVRTAGGDTVPCELRYCPVHDDGGTGGVVGLLREAASAPGPPAEGRWMAGALREGDAEFRRIADHLDEVVWMSAADQRDVLYVNPAFEEIWGRDRERLYEDAELLLESVHPEDRERIQRELDRQVDDEYEVEYRIVRPDGEVRWIHDSATPIRDDDGEVYRVVGEAQDVTERKERERALEERERQLSTLMDNVPGMVYRCRNEQGWPMEFVSGGSRELTGHDPEALERGDVSYGEDIVHEADRGGLWEDVQQELADDGSFLVTYRIETAGGTVKWVRERGRGIYDDDGELDVLEGVIIDVTERKRLETELDEILGRVTDGFYALDDEWRFTHVNERAEELLGRAEDELLGRILWEEFPETAAVDEIRESFEAAMETQEQTDLEIYSDLLGFWVEASIYPSETGLSVYFRDVTDRKRAQQRLREERDMFAEGPAVVFRWNPEADEGWPVEYVSGNVEEVFGYTPAELESGEVPYTDLLLEEELDRIAGEVEENSDDSTERFTHEPYRVRTRDGEIRWVKDITKIVRDDAGEITNYLGYLVDITERKERERELQRYERIVENLPVGVYRNTPGPDGEFVAMNSTLPEIFDADGEAELQAVNVSDLYPEPERRDEFSRRLEREGIVHDVELEQETLDGRRIWISVTAIRTEENGEVYFDGIVQDVTARKERERELERTKERYRSLAENFPNGGVGVYDEDLRYTLVTGTMWDDIEPDAADLEGNAVREALPPETADDVEPIFRGALEGRTGTVVSRLGGRTYRVWATPLRDADGEITGGQSFALDITDRLDRERHLERYETIVEAVNDGVYVVDADGQFTMVNEAYAEMLGYDREELLGEHVSLVVDEAVLEQAQELETAMRAGTEDSPTVEAELETASGDRLPAEATFAMLPGADDSAHRVGVARDISDRRERERELEESERRYRALAENFPNGLVTMFDHDLEYRLAAGQGFDRIPHEPDDLVGESFRDVWDDETAGALEPVFQAALDGEEQSVELASEGREWIVRAVPITDERGDVFAGMTMAQDITEQKERERYLEDAKSQFEAATEAGAVGTWEWEIQADTMVVGRSFARTFGVDPEEAREGVPLERFVSSIHPADRDRVEEKIEAAVESCGEYEAEYRVRNADGELRWVVARGSVESDEDGEPVRFPGAVTDITERKRAELELERSNEQLETLFEVLPVGVVVADPDGGFVEANDTAREIWGGDVFDADSVEEYEKYPVRRADTGEEVPPQRMTLARVLDGEEVTEPDIYEIDAVDGETRIIRLEGMPVRDETGEMVRGVVTLTDVTERKEAQRRLEESERRYRTLVEHFPNGAVGLFDQDLEYTAVGGQFLQQVGLDPEERVGNSVYDVYPEEILSEVEPHFQAALEGEASSFEVEFHSRHLHCNTLPVRNADDEVYAGMLVVQDVTERREYERRLEASNERLEQFAYAASHDLQEPLRMVSSYLRLIDNRYGDELDADGREFLEYAVDGADRMREMIDGLLQYSRVETQGDPLEPVDLDDVFADVRQDLGVRIEESDAEIAAEPLPRVRGDRSQLHQVLQNLLSNAIEYSGDEPPRVHVAAEPDGDRYEISVRDEGIGIDPEEADGVFEVFERLHSQADHGGTGIGLALCRRIVERHGGDIRVESEPGDGSTFTFTLPAAGEDDD